MLFVYDYILLVNNHSLENCTELNNALEDIYNANILDCIKI